MKIIDLLDLINRKLAGEMLQYDDVEPWLDTAIDQINKELNAVFPVFSELRQLRNGAIPGEYTCFPDKYIRNVIVPYVAYQFFVTDEEGISTAPAFEQEYNTQLFYMLRDYTDNIPIEYQAASNEGAIDMSSDVATARGIDVSGTVWGI